MSKPFFSETLESAWLQALHFITTHGELVPEKEPFLEVCNLQVSYQNTFELDSFGYRKIFGSSIFDYMKRVYSPTGDQKTGRNYYKLIHEQGGVDQVSKVTKILEEDPLSRCAVITLISPNSEKVPCVISVGFQIRKKLLHMNVLFRSSDFAKKFIPDMVELSNIHKKISRELHVACGKVTVVILCAQVYVEDLKKNQRKISRLKAGTYYKVDTVIENWDKEAQNWDKYIRDPKHYVNFEDGYSRFLDFLNKELLSVHKSSSVTALDSGCGTGAISDVLNKKGYKVVAIDISPKMLSFAHKNGTKRQYVLANCLDIPYKNDSFDTVCSRGVLISHVGKKYVDLFLNEHRRVLKSGGLFMFDFITQFKDSETKKKKNKAYMSFDNLSDKLKSHGFEILKRSGENINRVNAILCKKI